MAPKIPRAGEGMVCPFHQKDASEVCHKCPLWVEVRGNHPQTGQPVDDWRCSFAWMPMLMIETARKTGQAGAAIESFRNEVLRTNEEAQRILSEQVQPMLRNFSVRHSTALH